MNADREKTLLASLYDRLLDAVTYSPAGQSPPWKKDEIVFQMCKNMVLNPDDFKNMLSASNPNGDTRALWNFSTFVDRLPTPGALWSDSTKLVSGTYINVLTNAQTRATTRPEEQKLYDQAYKFLNTEITVKSMKGDKTTVVPSDEYLACEDAEANYTMAITGYRTAFNSYDQTDIKQQRLWQAAAPGLQLVINQTWNAWGRAGKAEVKEATDALGSSINNAISYVIADSRKLVAPDRLFPPMVVPGNDWLPSFALPTEWCSTDLKGVKLKFTSAYLNKEESTFAQSYSAAASGSWGLWHASAGVEGGNKEETAHMDAENLTLEAELMAVSVVRPWYNPLLLSMNDWYVQGFKKNGISSGDPSHLQGAMPLVSTGFVVAKNTKISADFSESDKKFISSAISTKASGGWGPFSISGSYGQEKSSTKFSSKFDGGTIELPGFQVLAFISNVTPPSPPKDPPA